MKRNLFIGLIFGIVMLSVVDVCAQGYVFGLNVRVSDYPPGGANGWPPNAGQRGVAVRGDTVYCVWSDNRAGRHNWFAKSVDGGQTFLPNVRVDDGVGDAFLPTLAVGNDGTIYVAWTDERAPFSYKQVFFSKSTDGGLTFAPDVIVNDTAGGIKNHPHRYPSMAVDTAGIIYIAFDDGRNGPPRYDIYFSKSTDGGETFTQDVMVNDSLPWELGYRTNPGLSADNVGSVYVVWEEESYHLWPDIYFSRSTDGGMTFLPDVAVSDTDSCLYRMRPSVNVDGRGYIHCVWYKNDTNANIYYTRSTDGGLTFSPNIRVNDAAHEPDPQAYPSMCVDDSGMVYAVWEEGPATHPDIYFTLSTDNGDSVFVEPNIKVTDVPPDSGMFNPSIAVNDSGKVYVLWKDFRNNFWNGDVYFATGMVSGIEESKDLRHKTTDIRLTIHPNPFTSVVSVKCSGIRERHTVSLKIYDMSGRLVKNFSFSTAEYQPTFTVVWDGKDKIGEEVPTGVYFVELKVRDKEIKGKIIYVK